jgi:hypothetical protein
MPIGLIADHWHELPQDKLIVTYCTCKAEQTSLEAAELLMQHGFERLGVLTGGYPAWKEAGHPIASNYEPESAGGEARSGAGRLAPPAAVSCDRNQLTSYTGSVRSYRREQDKTLIVIETSAGTVERITLRHSDGRPGKRYLINGTPFTEADWNRLEKKKGELLENMSAVAWVCQDGRTIIDWRPGVTFTGVE